jgi:MFS family permease
MYLGAALTLLALAVIGQHRRSGLPRPPVSAFLLALVAAWFFDGANSTWLLVTEQALLYQPNNILRLVTGFGAGFAIACALSPIYAGILRAHAEARPVLDPPWSLPALLAMAGSACALAVTWRGIPWWLWAALLATMVFGVMSMVNAVVVAMVLSHGSTEGRRARIIGTQLAGIVLSALELAALAVVKQMVLYGRVAY